MRTRIWLFSVLLTFGHLAFAGVSELKQDSRMFGKVLNDCFPPDAIRSLLTNDNIDAFVKLMAATDSKAFRSIRINSGNAKQKRLENALASANGFPDEGERQALIRMMGTCSDFRASQFKDARLRRVIENMITNQEILIEDLQADRISYPEIAFRNAESQESLNRLFIELGDDMNILFNEKVMQKIMGRLQSLPAEISRAFKKYYDISPPM